MSLFLGLDIGTSAVKAIIVDAEDREQASAVAPLSIDHPRPLWSEQHPDAWWTASVAVLDRLAAEHPKLMSGVAALGLSGQMLGVALIDAAGRPIRPAPLWNDGRAVAECAELDANVTDFAGLAGARPMPGFAAPKILWLSRHEPDALKRTRNILLTKDYVRLCLTGEAISDRADSSATLLMDTQAGAWSSQLAGACGISTDLLPELVESGASGGMLRSELARRFGLRANLPIAGGAGDNMAGAIGAGVVRAGDAYISLGTSGVYFVANDRFVPARDQGMHTHRHAVPGLFGQHGCVLSAASALNWVAGVLGIASIERFLAEIEAADLSPADIPVFSPYLGGERTPHDDPLATATLSNLRGSAGALHIGRAVLEGVAFAIADCHDALTAAGASIGTIALVGGGARSRFWGQLIATAIDRPLLLPPLALLGPALGAARLARQASGGGLSAEGDRRGMTVLEPNVGWRSGLEERRAIYRQHYAKSHGENICKSKSTYV
ncbi:xylulokinase [Bradyrhizobium japonicum]|uniref:xylulokinase n=1 Tax=Bradyrhizobium japonicum TaxID=375 RepID=UPI001BA690C0|nr:xylulokinase [Bradyrhizobium japonicum]MBR0916300.1 xylulokinase [Bradyrhizobium japonicum]